MKNLNEILKKRIFNFGPISISEFILEANLNTRFGYYNNNLPFGKNKASLFSIQDITLNEDNILIIMVMKLSLKVC